jgi:hypothetical protein
MPFHCQPIAKANQNRLIEKFFANWETFPVERIFSHESAVKASSFACASCPNSFPFMPSPVVDFENKLTLQHEQIKLWRLGLAA